MAIPAPITQLSRTGAIGHGLAAPSCNQLHFLPQLNDGLHLLTLTHSITFTALKDCRAAGINNRRQRPQAAIPARPSPRPSPELPMSTGPSPVCPVPQGHPPWLPPPAPVGQSLPGSQQGWLYLPRQGVCGATPSAGLWCLLCEMTGNVCARYQVLLLQEAVVLASRSNCEHS